MIVYKVVYTNKKRIFNFSFLFLILLIIINNINIYIYFFLQKKIINDYLIILIV